MNSAIYKDIGQVEGGGIDWKRFAVSRSAVLKLGEVEPERSTPHSRNQRTVMPKPQ